MSWDVILVDAPSGTGASLANRMLRSAGKGALFAGRVSPGRMPRRLEKVSHSDNSKFTVF